jgi:hypothetical protein
MVQKLWDELGHLQKTIWTSLGWRRKGLIELALKNQTLEEFN